jgi:hypothetical protein
VTSTQRWISLLPNFQPCVIGYQPFCGGSRVEPLAHFALVFLEDGKTNVYDDMAEASADGYELLMGMLRAMIAESKILKLVPVIQTSKKPTRMALQPILELIRRRLDRLVDI